MEKRIDDKCIFCKICKGEVDTQLLYEDEEYVVFKDRAPYAQHHYLVVTKNHIPDAKCLKKDQLNIVSTMKGIGRKILEDSGADMNDSSQNMLKADCRHRRQLPCIYIILVQIYLSII
ncbi:adenosine 5'-monophosphoramidase HINT3-like isoform X2 [Hetaerina americana]|uniref:adenosine 5'-monophosphoramidase HINT3-like isoform X2 n=1 Tax=Hetaerina americana TaxID=62018 RepID=UPI003A7F1462